MVLEIRAGGRDKGSAIAEFMAEPPFRGRTAVFIGDDLTDEFGFGVVNELGGISVKVGEGPSRARWRIADAAAVRAWLAEWALRHVRRRA
jgi:trehalose 6-phosphate phosphatase